MRHSLPRLLAAFVVAAAAAPAWTAQVVIPPGAALALPGGSMSLACADVTVQGVMNVGASQVLLARNVTIAAGGSLAGGAGTLSLGGDWSNSGTFTRGTGTVAFVDGCSLTQARITGTNAFNNLAFTSALGRTLVLPPGGATSVYGGLTLAGIAGLPVQVVSANPSQPTSIALGAGATVSTTFATLGPGVTVGLVTSATGADFGGQSMYTTSPPIPLSIVNQGGTPLAVSSVAASTHFSVTHNCATVPANAACTANVRFTPTAEGPLVGTLSVVSSAGTQTLALTGTGERSLVTHYYRSILRRAPDTGGKAFWEGEAVRVAALGANLNETWFAMAQGFFASGEYLALARDDAGYVTDLYNTFFNRAPDAAGMDFWVSQLGAGMPREVLLAAFMFSAEFSGFTRAIFGDTTVRSEIDTVVDFYRGLLSRLPDNGGFAFWRGEFRAAQCAGAGAVTSRAEAISSAFALSGEYAARARSNTQYVGDLYNAFLRRGGDLAGVRFWIGALDRGASTREQVRQAFVASPEFQARVQAVIAAGCQP